MTTWWAEHAWIGDRIAHDVTISVEDGRIVTVEESSSLASDWRLHGLVLPGFVNAHSHAFHRALRGKTHRAGSDFWAWRDQMYAVAANLSPDSYYWLARGTFSEMVLAGITHVGEFHYLHHDPDGHPYTNPNSMAEALVRAADEAGLRITVLDAAYLQGGPDSAPLNRVQARFSDKTINAWQARVDLLRASLQNNQLASLGVAAHSIRALTPATIAAVAEAATTIGVPLHFHLSEQPAENDESIRSYGTSPTEVFAAAGALGERSTAVHATHLDTQAIDLLTRSQTGVCVCPTTERDLGDGIGPISKLQAGGSNVALGTDSHAVIDLIEESRELELHQRLLSGRRGHHKPSDLLNAATTGGARSLGRNHYGLVAGSEADFIAVSLDSRRLAGWNVDDIDGFVFAASGDDVTDVIVAGCWIVRDRIHLCIEDPSADLHRAILAVTIQDGS